MKRRKRTLCFIVSLILFISGIVVPTPGEIRAASSYTNAKEFFESTDGRTHAEAYAGTIYFATYAKLASGSYNRKYTTIGYDIKLEGNGQKVELSVKRGGSMQEIESARVRAGNYEYLLYAVSEKKIFELVSTANPYAAAMVLSSPTIDITLNAIVTTKQGSTIHGGIEENGSGGLTEWGSVYHLKNSSDLAKVRRIFAGHTFESYSNIYLSLDNHELQVQYKLNGGTVSGNYSSWNDMLYQNGSPIVTKARILEKVTLVNQDNISLTKKGYHTIAGKEWTYAGRYYDDAPGSQYMPKDIYPSIGTGGSPVKICMEANWQINTYTIRYHSNGGTGFLSATTMKYNDTGALKKNVFTRNGYYFTGWNTKADGTGTDYTDEQTIRNLTENHGEVIDLYARWQPLVLNIAADKQGGSGGTDHFYEKFNVGWFLDPGCLMSTDSLLIPQKKGYHFMSYYEGAYGMGKQITDAAGKLLIASDYFYSDTWIYAHWQPKKFTITFDKQGGMGGTDRVTAVYDSELPAATAPIRTGYSFKGYYTEPNGGGELYYNEFMAADTKYRTDQDLTLYAYWVDDSKPDVTLTADINGWTCRNITLTAETYDHGSGLSSFTLYHGEKKVAEKTELEGSGHAQIMFVNPTEGAVTYKAVAVDVNGNRTEAFRTVYYDIKAPSGTITAENYDGIHMSLTVEDVNDINVK